MEQCIGPFGDAPVEKWLGGVEPDEEAEQEEGGEG
jgi:hypothetical protein